MSKDLPNTLENLPPLKQVIAQHNLQAQKSLGQNFLLDQNITDKIVRSAGTLTNHTVFEIGPGPGGLTRSLLKSDAKHVIAVEFDERAIKALQDLKTAAQDRLDLMHGDAMKTDLTSLSDAPRAIVANLPYNIATPLLVGWLAQIRADKENSFSSMTLMFQKEVAQRIVARPSTKAYGRLAVLCQWLCDVQIVYDLPPSAFTPPPKVNSAVVHFRPKDLSLSDPDDPTSPPDFKAVETITAAAFGQRRKMIRSSLKDYADKIEALGIDPTLRAENLSLQDFIKLAQ